MLKEILLSLNVWVRYFVSTWYLTERIAPESERNSSSKPPC